MRTNVYVDGFNLYYGSLRGTPHKWLDLEQLCQKLLPNNNIHRIRYFTARIIAKPTDVQAPTRQAAYLRAIATIPCVSIHYGHFLQTTTRMPLAHPPRKGGKTVEVIKTEEKGSDVNLATHMLVDAFNRDAERFVVISNDSDLVGPMRVVKEDLGKVVGFVNPHPKERISRAILKIPPTFTKQVRVGMLSSSQFPQTLTDKDGTITKPADWA